MLADFFKINLPYTTTGEFIDYVNSEDSTML